MTWLDLISVLIFHSCFDLALLLYLITRVPRPSRVLFHWLYCFIKASNYASSGSRPAAEAVEYSRYCWKNICQDCEPDLGDAVHSVFVNFLQKPQFCVKPKSKVGSEHSRSFF